jgi:hypothetical protein
MKLAEGMSRLFSALFAIALVSSLPASASSAPDPARLRSGAVELGIAGAVVADEGATDVTVALRAGSFLTSGPGLAGLEAETAYARIRGLDRLDVSGALSWSLETKRALYPFAAFTAGVRQEWLGSFRNSLGRVGGAAGVRALFGSRAAMRFEYRMIRFLDDPGPDFTEHQVLFGVSIFFRNTDP